ncbi:MAG: M23 family metallopeptidase [Clostridia bacterium]|nr:M23 family metallopeptidase [Clostridia bacterium]
MRNIGRRIAGAYARAKDWVLEYSYVVTLAAAIAVVAATAMYTEHLRIREESRAAAAQAEEISATALPKITATPLPTIAPLLSSSMTYTPRRTTVRPAGGAILRAYESEPVLWKALGVYKAHEAIDIAGEEDEGVKSAMDGVVTGTEIDALWGWKVAIAHTDGSVGTYAGLKMAFVSSGQSVSRGEEIGALLDKIPCEAELPAHLHFELAQNGNRQDPEGILPE